MTRPIVSWTKFDFGSVEPLYDSIFRVLHRYQSENMEPGAEHWQADTRHMRPKLVNDIREEWQVAINQYALFPWHDDYVVSCWVAMRKATNSQKRELCKWYDLPIPHQWELSDE